MSTIRETLGKRAQEILTGITEKYGTNTIDEDYNYSGGIATHISKRGNTSTSRELVTDENNQIISSTDKLFTTSPQGARLQTFFSRGDSIMPDSVNVTQGITTMTFAGEPNPSKGKFNGFVAQWNPFQQNIQRTITTKIDPISGKATQYKLDKNDYQIGGATLWGLSQTTLEPDSHTKDLSIISGPITLKTSFSESQNNEDTSV